MRSKWKGQYISSEVNKLYKKNVINKSNIYSRNTHILKEFIGLNLNVHNGLTFYPIHISADMVGYKLGEFIFTKRTGTLIHKNQLKKQANKLKR